MIERRNMLIGILVGVVLVGGALGVSGYTRKLGLPGLILAGTSAAFSNTESKLAPEFASGDWINSEPLTLKGLRGRVVVIEFWTFGCYNCRNTLPFVKRWDERYRKQGLTIVGVHSPEFDYEKKVANLREEVTSLGIRYPVVSDNEYETWKAYDVQAWPTLFVLDKAGRVRWTHVGEGAYDETERTIQKLLDEQPSN